jgi:dCTP deaminase
LIYCDHHIEKAIRQGLLLVDPIPDPSQYDSSSLNLRVGDDFRKWKKSLKTPATKHSIDLDNINLEELIEFTDPLRPDHNGLIIIEPGAFVIVRTLEYIRLPLKSKPAARVEGRSKMARLGLTAHITAPTIHSGFGGRVTLEILNHGPFQIEVRPNESKLAQLIIEEVSGVPKRRGSTTFSNQSTPLGTPKRPSRSGH